jgi:SAM-dependent methyltransferase
MLDEVQRKNGISGNVAEIGVYHGKLLLALAHLAPPGSTVLAIDVFDEQQWNLDGSGEGSLEALRENIDRYGPSGRDYRVVKADSLALTAYDKNLIMTEAGPFRMFSVDGCHTAEHVFNDLLTAQDLLSPGGVIILDDYMQPHWPGVTEAVHRFYAFGVPRVKPFLYCDHKLYLTHYGHHNLYYEAAKNQFGADSEFRSIEMFGSPVVALYPIP